MPFYREAAEPGETLPEGIEVDPSPWHTAGAGVDRPWKAAIVKLSDRVQVEWIDPKSIPHAEWKQFAVSRPGTLAVARVKPGVGDPFVVASMYAPWESEHPLTGRDWIYADGSAHRIISDLENVLGHPARHRIIAAGDLNILYGYGEHGDNHNAARFATVF